MLLMKLILQKLNGNSQLCMFCKLFLIMKIAFSPLPLIMILTKSISYTSGMELTFFGGDWSAMLNLEIFAVNDWWLNLVTFNEAVINSTRKRDELELALARAEHSLSLMAMLPTYVWHCKMSHTVWPSKFVRFTQKNLKPQASDS